MKKLTTSLGAALVLSAQLVSPAFAQASDAPDKPLTGAEVLDYDGRILRNALEAQAGENRPAKPVTPSVTLSVPGMSAVPVRRKDITVDVYGIDARAVGGPVVNSARIRYDNRYYKVSVRSQVGELRVLRITQAGTTLAGLNGKRAYTVFLPYEDEAAADAAAPVPPIAVAPTHPVHGTPQPEASAATPTLLAPTGAVFHPAPHVISGQAMGSSAAQASFPTAGAAARSVQGIEQHTATAKPPMLAPAAAAPVPPGLIPPLAASQPQAGTKQTATPQHLSPPALAAAPR